MRTFLFPPGYDTLPDLPQLEAELAAFIRLQLPLARGMPEIFTMMKKRFQADAVLCTVASGVTGAGKVQIFPPVAYADKLEVPGTPEQLKALAYGPGQIVRLGNDADHGITIGILKQIFPGRKFFALVARSITDEVIFSCTLVSFTARASNPFCKAHVNAAFRILEPLAVYVKSKTRLPDAPDKPKQPRVLPLTALPGLSGVCEQIWQVARHDCPVLLLGETGSGKEAVAETLFRASGRAGGPYIKINCGGLAESLLESELFGHEKGSFTGAVNARKGIFERASGGTLLLDEIGELSLYAQTRLLRVLQEGVVERIGAEQEKNVDVRVIAATHRNPEAMARAGNFRSDLFYRLNVFPIAIPPLRERPEDIPILVRFFISRKCQEISIPALPEPTEETFRRLKAYPWPGNLRELANAVERAIIAWICDMKRPLVIETGAQVDSVSASESDKKSACMIQPGLATLNQAIIEHIRKALELSGGRIGGNGGAAELLSIHPNTLRAKMRKLGISSNHRGLPENQQ